MPLKKDELGLRVSANLVGVRQYRSRPLGLRDGRCAYKKRREGDMVLRTFIGLALRLIDRGAHRETTAWDRHQIEPAS